MAATATDGVVGRVMSILSAFQPDDHALSLAELVRRTGLPKTTVHRLLGELAGVRLLERQRDGRYLLGGGLFELGMRASVERQLLEVAMPFMQDLYGRSQETVHLGVREGVEIVYVSKIGGHRQTAMPSRIGGRMPLHCTAIGKVLLAYSGRELFTEIVSGELERRTPRTVVAPGLLSREIDRVLETGIAHDREESAIGLVCVAAPVLDRDDLPLAAISITGPTTRFVPDRHIASLRAAASGVAATLARRADMLAH